jgi:predicted porin
VLVIAGEAYRVRISLVNKGNMKTRIKLEIKGDPDYPVKLEPTEIALEAGRSQTLSIEVKTDEKLNRRINHILRMKAVGEEAKEGILFTEQTIFVEIIPKVTGEIDPYHRLSSQIRLAGVIEDRKEGKEQGFQLEFSGSGDLDEAGKRRIEFLFRGPDIQKKSILGEQDEYRFSFYSGPFDIHLGDRGYSLSPLTEQFKYGTGAEVDVHPEKFGVGAFFFNTRFGEPKEKEIGTYLRYQFGDMVEIKGNFLNKNIPDKDFTDNLFSIQGKIRPSEKMDLGLEYGFGESDRDKNFIDYAYRIDFKGRLSENFWYSFERTYAGPKFFGYYHGVDYTTGAITFPIYDKLRGNFNFHQTKDEFDLELDPKRTTANREISVRGGISYSFSFGTNASLDYEDFQTEDRLQPADYDFREKIFRLGLGQTFRKVSLQTYIERGELEYKLFPSKNGHLASYSIYGNFQPSDWQRYNIYTRFGDDLYTENPKRTISAGISGNWIIKDRLNININYQRNIIDPDKHQEQNNIFSIITYTLPNHHSLALKSRWTKSKDGNDKETSLYLSYTIPLKIPIGKKKSIGMIKGRVYDGEKPEKSPVPNAILTADGATAVTNRNGQFIFPALKPGNYYLQVEKGSIGLKRTTIEKLPTVLVKGGETTEIEIPIVTSCKILGRVMIYAPKSERIDKEKFDMEDLKEIGGLASILIEISKGNEVVRQLTDDKGRFSFEDLRPGNWILKIYEDELPPHHYLEEKEFKMELKPGEEKEFIVKVLPRMRRIEIIEEGEIKEEKKK